MESGLWETDPMPKKSIPDRIRPDNHDLYVPLEFEKGDTIDSYALTVWADAQLQNIPKQGGWAGRWINAHVKRGEIKRKFDTEALPEKGFYVVLKNVRIVESDVRGKHRREDFSQAAARIVREATEGE